MRCLLKGKSLLLWLSAVKKMQSGESPCHYIQTSAMVHLIVCLSAHCTQYTECVLWNRNTTWVDVIEILYIKSSTPWHNYCVGLCNHLSRDLLVLIVHWTNQISDKMERSLCFSSSLTTVINHLLYLWNMARWNSFQMIRPQTVESK